MLVAMLSVVHHASKSAARVLVLAALSGPSAIWPQPALDPAANPEREMVETIAREQAQNGPNSEGLIDPMSRLAFLYEERGDHALAAAAIERLLTVVRANEGLHSLEQAPLIRRLISLQRSRGNLQAAWDLEQDLLTLARRHPDDPRTVPIFRESADARVDVLGRLLAGESATEVELSCYGAWPRYSDALTGALDAGSCRTGNTREFARAVAADAQRSYADAIAVLLRNASYSSDELRELEVGLLRSIELLETSNGYRTRASTDDVTRVVSQSEPWRSWLQAIGELAHLTVPNPSGLTLEPDEPDTDWFDYLLARESLVRLYAYELAASAPLTAQVEAFVRIADWDLLYSRNKPALEAYEQAYRLLDERGARASIDAIFSPQTPVVLPAFLPNPLASAETDAAAGYIEVAFKINAYGQSRQVEIVAASPNVTDADKERVFRLIKDSRFRPRVAGGELARAAPVRMRYHLTE